MSDAFKPLLARLAAGEVLSEADADSFFAACLRGEPTPAQIASAVTCMRFRGETVVEITSGARALRRSSVTLDHPYDVIDVCGTGGDGANTFNISTAVAFVAAGGGLKVAKHGTRAVTSASGSSDVLIALGVNITSPPQRQRQALDEAGVCFLFAPAHISAMQHVLPVRQDLGFRTIFNILGPLSNPANARRQVLGVFDPHWLEPMAAVLGALGATRTWVVHGSGLDELTTTGTSEVAEWSDGTIRRFTISPQDVGLAKVEKSQLRGGDAPHNAVALRGVLNGVSGPYRDIVLLNAAAAFVVAERALTLIEGIELAARSIESGAAVRALDSLIRISQIP